ncbi:MAG: ATP-dependent Clp protease ATP-binding subunit [Bacilli bacterium]|nr:ATP-dependent Clp protease ATP-binding subunit [Bacilli bacterium]
MFSNFTEEARKILVEAKKEMYELRHPYVGSEHLLLAILKEDSSISRRLKEYDLDYDIFKKEIISIIGLGSKPSDWFLYTPLLRRILENAVIESKEHNNNEVTIEHLFASLLEEGEGVAIRIMMGLKIDIDEIYSEFTTKNINYKKKKNRKLLLEELGNDLTNKALNNELDPVIGREKEIKRVLEILSRRTKNNPLLIGEAGVGKTAIVEELSRLIVSGDVPRPLKNKRIISLDMATTVAGTKYRGEFEERVSKILKEIEENNDIILFIDEIHTLVGAGGAEGAIDASNIFKPALARNKLRCIGATTIDEYKKFIEKDGALERRFQKVLISTPDNDTLKAILSNLKDIYEKYHYVKVNDEIIDDIIRLSERYIYDRNQPDKAIDLLDEVCAKVSLKESKEVSEYNKLNKSLQKLIQDKKEAIIRNDFELASTYKDEENRLMNEINNLELELYKNNVKEVTKEDVAEVINIKTGIPVYELLNDNIKIINQIETSINDQIIGQKQAKEEIINIAKRIKMGFKDDNTPYGIMFTGSSGVGKTKLAKIFGENLVGSKNVIKIDMSEFVEGHSTSKIVGAPPGYVGYSDNHNILDEIKNKPYSVLILDEIEKASPNVINLFFQILDEGKIKDASGSIVRFDNVIIIMTSNIGFIDNNIGFNKVNNDAIMTKLKENFSIPFINRLTNIVIFDKITKEEVKVIINKQLEVTKSKYLNKGITLSYTENIVEEILELSNYDEFGARRIDMIIKNYVEKVLIEAVIGGKKKLKIDSIKKITTLC